MFINSHRLKFSKNYKFLDKEFEILISYIKNNLKDLNFKKISKITEDV